jgi:ubiquinone/menaquinone biosynthesis C-methylase UbiE
LPPEQCRVSLVFAVDMAIVGSHDLHCGVQQRRASHEPRQAPQGADMSSNDQPLARAADSAQSEWQQRPEATARRYQQNGVPNIFEPWARELVRLATIQSGERMLDVACGTGVVTRIAAELVGPTGSVAGLDISPSMLSVARSFPQPNGAVIEWYEGTAETLPFADASFDVVTCQFGLQFFGERLAGLREMRRVLAPGGKVAISVWQGLDQNPVDQILVEAVKRHAGPAAILSTAVAHSLGDADDLRDLVASAGWREVTVSSLEKQHRSLSPDSMVARALTPAMDEATRSAIRTDVLTALEPFRSGDEIVFPMRAHIVTARS